MKKLILMLMLCAPMTMMAQKFGSKYTADHAVSARCC